MISMYYEKVLMHSGKLLVAFCFLIDFNCLAQDKYFGLSLDSANVYIRNGDYYKAIRILSDLEKHIGNKITLQHQYLLFNLYGKAINESGDPSNAAVKFQKGMDLAIKYKDSIALADFYLQLARVNVHNLGDLALHQLNEAEDIYTRLKRKDRLMQLYFRKGVYYSFMSNIDSTNFYFDKVMPMAEREKADSLIHSIHLNKGVAYSVKGKSDSALKHMRLALKVALRSNAVRDLPLCYGNYAWLLNDAGKYDSSMYYSHKALDLAFKTNSYRAKIVAFDNIIDLSKKKNDYKTAFMSYQKSRQLMDSFTNENKSLFALKNQLDHEYKDKESQLKLNNLLKEKQASEKLLKQKQFTYSVIAALVIIAIATFILYGRFKVIRKQKILIESQHTALEEKNKLIEEKQKEILESIRYAQRIQQAHLPHLRSITRHFERLRKN